MNIPLSDLLREYMTAFVALALSFSLNYEAQAGDTLLFDGETLRGWTTLDRKPVTNGWEVVEGMIHLKPSSSPAGHIITEREFGDFDLKFEWKIAPGGNSGLKYRVRDYEGQFLGCEYQIIDDVKYSRLLAPRQKAGALYDLFEPIPEKILYPAGKFNSSRIVISNNDVKHWLNGRLVVAATIGSEKWKSRLAESKFSDLKDFGLNPLGRLMLTDHGYEVWYRNFDYHPLRHDAARSKSDSTKIESTERVLPKQFRSQLPK